jgi:DNA mismatch repair ATPase MutS
MPVLLRENNNYTVFGEDVKIAAQILGTTLIKVNGKEETGFPANALNTSLTLLVMAGQRVAIVDRLEMPKISQLQVHPEKIKHSTNDDNNQINIIYPVFDARKEELDSQRWKLKKLSPYSDILQEHHKQGSLVTEQNGQIGFLKERYCDNVIFKSLELSPL